jgi:multidrug transporter EmrE-like cation transporter
LIFIGKTGVTRMKYIYIFGTIFFTIVGQLVIKWQMVKVGQLPDSIGGKVVFLFNCFTNPYIILGFVSALVASLCWMAAMTKFDLSYAYPFMSLSFVLVMILSGLLFHEPITIYKIAGLCLIVAGIMVGAR